jgi:hypothetical protein
MEVEYLSLHRDIFREYTCRKLNCQVTLYGRIDADAFPILAEVFICYDAVYLGKKSIIATTTYISARMDFGSQLTNKDVACLHHLSAKALDSAPLSPTVATVPRTTTSFLMCHRITPSSGKSV